MKKLKKKSRLTEAFEQAGSRNEKALITFITAGDPGLRSSADIVLELEKAGADIIELGIPFSDPMADGPTIQASSERAVGKGITVASVLRLLRVVRAKSSVPVVLFGYYNPIYKYGLKRFARDAKKAGADGVLVVDLPPEESGDLNAELDKVGVDLIYLLTPTSDAARIRMVTERAGGFIYYVSLTGVTGAGGMGLADVASNVKKVKRHTDLPVAVGFGISTPSDVRRISRFADGVVVGSAIINVIAKNLGQKRLPQRVGRFVSALKKSAR